MPDHHPILLTISKVSVDYAGMTTVTVDPDETRLVNGGKTTLSNLSGTYTFNAQDTVIGQVEMTTSPSVIKIEGKSHIDYTTPLTVTVELN